MASLFDLLMGNAQPKISSHTFAAALREYEDGHQTKQAFLDAFGLTNGEHGTDLQALKNLYAASINKGNFISELEAVLILAENDSFGLGTEAAFNARVQLIP
jgi:hypothetical protein